MGNGIAALNLDELTEVIDQNANGNTDNEPISIENTEGYDLVEVYNDDETITAPGDKSLIDRMIESFYKRTGQVQKSREQFQIKVHKRIVDLMNSTSKTVDALMQLDMPAGVDIEIKT